MSEHKYAKYLEKDGEIKLFHGDDVEDAKGDGWKEPEGKKSNGEEWNPAPVEDEVSIADAQAEVLKANEKRQEKIDAKEAAEQKKQDDAAAKARADQEKAAKAAR